MADVTLNLELTGTWKDVKTELSLTDGMSYLVDIVAMQSGGRAQFATTDNTTEPSTTLIPHDWISSQDPAREYPVKSNRYLWMRAERGTCVLVVTEV